MKIFDLPEITETRVDMAINAVNTAYAPLPETTCLSRNCCCNISMPNLYFSEFINIYKNFVLKMSREARLNLTIECVKHYLIGQGPGAPNKPCAFLGSDKMCTVYSARPLKCRTYGLIPDSLYKWIVSSVSEESGIPEKDIPLCVQCPFVKIKPEFASLFPNGKLPEKMIRSLELELRAIDSNIMGISAEMQKNGFGFLTYNNWHLMFEMGVEWMEKLTPLRLNLTQEKKDEFVETLKSVLQQSIFNVKEETKNG